MTSTCHFCAHGNPAGSKFCNECGSPLDLKPCPQCDAMNHVDVDQCYQCRAPFAADRGVEVAEVDSGAVAAPAAGSEPGERMPATFDSIPIALSGRLEPRSEAAGVPERDMTRNQTSARAATRSEAPEREATRGDVPAHDAPRRIADEPPEAPEFAPQAVARYRAAQRRGAPYAAVAGIAVCAIAAVSYYAYTSGKIPDVARLAAALLTKDRPSSPPPAPAVASPSQSGTAEPLARTSPEHEGSGVADALPAPVPASPPALAAPSVAAPTAATGGGSAPGPASAPVSAPAPAPASAPAPARASVAASAPASRPRSASPAAQKKLPATSSEEAVQGGGTTSRPASARPAVDKDALATQRLIERDLAGFLPPARSPGSAPRAQ